MTTPLSPSELLACLQWRYATKKFDVSRKIPQDIWGVLEQSLVLAPSAYGLQPWKFLIVTDPELKAKLPRISRGQTQPLECSHLVIFTMRKDLGVDHVERYLDRITEVRGVSLDALNGYRQTILNSLKLASDHGHLNEWQSRQVYIALGQFMTSAALLGVDTCPMEGFEKERYDEVLGLTGTDFATLAACPAGYRSPEDKYSRLPKVRFDAKEVILHL